MALSEKWVQDLLDHNCTLEAPPYAGSGSGAISRNWIDGALVIYDLEDPPAWLKPILMIQDEDGNTDVEDVILTRRGAGVNV